MSWQIWDPPAIIIPAPPKAEIQISLEQEESISKEEHYRKVYDTPWNKLQPDGRINMAPDGTAASISPYSKHYRSQVEDGIWPLVELFYNKGYLTVSSCAGHRGNLKHEFEEGFSTYQASPYVMIVVNRICVDEIVTNLKKLSSRHVEISSVDSMANMNATYASKDKNPKRSRKKDIENEYESLNWMMQRNYDEWSYIMIRINPWKKYSISYLIKTQLEQRLINSLVKRYKNLPEYIF